MTTLVMDKRKDVACDAGFALRSIAILGQPAAVLLGWRYQGTRYKVLPIPFMDGRYQVPVPVL